MTDACAWALGYSGFVRVVVQETVMSITPVPDEWRGCLRNPRQTPESVNCRAPIPAQVEGADGAMSPDPNRRPSSGWLTTVRFSSVPRCAEEGRTEGESAVAIRSLETHCTHIACAQQAATVPNAAGIGRTAAAHRRARCSLQKDIVAETHTRETHTRRRKHKARQGDRALDRTAATPASSRSSVWE